MNKYNPKIHARKSIRLKGYDYSQAVLYFLTICCQNRAFLFGKIVGAHPCGCPEVRSNGSMENENDFEIGKMILNEAGKMIVNEWLALKKRFANIELHEYVVMPNHFHAIFEIGQPLGIAPTAAPKVDMEGIDEMGQPQGIAPTAALKNEDHDNSIESIRTSKVNMQPRGVTPMAVEKNKTVSDIMAAFKSITTVEYIRGVKTLEWKPFKGRLWQRNYWEHIIRSEKAYFNISNYIIKNPSNWKEGNDDWEKFK